MPPISFLIQFYLTAIIFIGSVGFAQAMNYTKAEKASINKLRTKMGDALYKDYMKSEPYLVRWIHARDFNLDEASEMLSLALKWRKQNKIDGILNETVYEFSNPVYYIDAIDKKGGIVTTVNIGKVNMRDLLLTAPRSVALRYYDQMLERIEVATMTGLGAMGKMGRDGAIEIIGGTMIMDWMGYSRIQHGCLLCTGIYLEWLQRMEQNYPGYHRHIININAVRGLTSLFDLMRPLLNEKVNFQVLGQRKGEWLPVLRKIVSSDQLRYNFGGTKPE